MASMRKIHSRTIPEVRFWALFAVVLALVTQVLFPAQLMAMPTADGKVVMLCADGLGQPMVDTAATKLTQSPVKKPGIAGLKCSQCVLASITAIAAPTPAFQPAVYAVSHAEFTPDAGRSPVKARAPPRPHSCGPPSRI